MVTRADLAFTGLADTPFLAAAAAKLVGTAGEAGLIKQAAEAAVGGVEANDDIHAPAEYRLHLARVAAVKVTFQLDVELSEMMPPKSLRMSARGKAPGSGVEVRTDLEIAPVAPNRSRLKWTAASEVRGTVASVGARLLKGTAKKLTESFWEKFAERVGAQSK